MSNLLRNYPTLRKLRRLKEAYEAALLRLAPEALRELSLLGEEFGPLKIKLEALEAAGGAFGVSTPRQVRRLWSVGRALEEGRLEEPALRSLLESGIPLSRISQAITYSGSRRLSPGGLERRIKAAGRRGVITRLRRP